MYISALQARSVEASGHCVLRQPRPRRWPAMGRVSGYQIRTFFFALQLVALRDTIPSQGWDFCALFGLLVGRVVKGGVGGCQRLNHPGRLTARIWVIAHRPLGKCGANTFMPHVRMQSEADVLQGRANPTNKD